MSSAGNVALSTTILRNPPRRLPSRPRNEPDTLCTTPKGPDMNFGNMNTGDCQPLQCDKAMNCIEGVRNPVATALEMSSLRSRLIDCPPCLQAFDMEVKLKTTMAPSISELPTAEFCLRITETLASIDLSKLDITDFG